MSEKLHSQKSHEHKGETDPTNSQEIAKHIEKTKQDTEKRAESTRHNHAEKVERIRSQIEAEAKSKHEHEEHHKTKESEKTELEQPVLINKELKQMTYKRTLRKTQNKLPAPYKTLSKVIHQPVVEAVSEVAGKTVARPSGVLMGGVFAFIGSSLFLWISKHYGYEYNFLLFLSFFAGGFIIGILVELGLYLANRKSK